MNKETKMILSIDSICQRYHVLPSELIRSGDMIDYWIASAAGEYQEHAEKMRKEGRDPMKGYYHGKSQEELMAMRERAQRHGSKKVEQTNSNS